MHGMGNDGFGRDSRAALRMTKEGAQNDKEWLCNSEGANGLNCLSFRGSGASEGI